LKTIKQNVTLTSDQTHTEGFNMNVIAYTRVSTNQQSESGHSLDYQASKIKCYCELHNLNIIDMVTDTASGKSINRQGINRILDMVNNQDTNGLKIDGIVILKLDRLTRVGRDFHKLNELLFNDSTGVTLHSVENHINTSTPHGKAMLNMLLTFSEFELDTLKERTKAGLRAKKDKGEPLGRASYGYEYQDKKLVKADSEQKIIARIKRLKKNGMTLADIREKLFQEKKYSRSGRKFTLSLISELARGVKRDNKKRSIKLQG